MKKVDFKVKLAGGLALDKSIDFLLENAGAVIQYRLRKEILGNITKTEKENLLRQIEQTPYFKLVHSYIKPSGYIGNGGHTHSNWRGVNYHETPLQDGESAARLLSAYAIPKNYLCVKNFVAAMQDENILREEFSYTPPALKEFDKRFIGLNSGNCLGSMLYVMQALLGYGDDYDDLQNFQKICLKGFEKILEINSIDDITRFDPAAKRKYNYPYIQSDEYFPSSYTLTMLAYTQNWRNSQKIKMLADSINRINEIMKPGTDMHILIKGFYKAPWGAFCRPIRAFRTDIIDVTLYRRLLTEIAMLGVGKNVKILRESADNIEEALSTDGILRLNFNIPHNKRYSPRKLENPNAYSDIRLEIDYSSEKAFLCDLTFWAVQFLFYYNAV